MAYPADPEIKDEIQKLVSEIDIESTGLKQFVKLLSKKMQVDLKPKKDFVKETLTKLLTQKHEEADQEYGETEDSPEQDESGDQSEEEVKPKRKGRGGAGSGGGGLAQKKEISDELADFLGKGKSMARKDIVKYLWEYIRENNLQNPEKKQEIILDKRMKRVFGCDRFTMFSMNKYIGAHIHPFKPVDLTSAPRKTPKKRKASKQKGGDEKKRKSGTQPPYRLSAELEAVVGASILPRPQVVSKIWEYIKARELQNPEDKREILCDDKLKAVMKKDKVTMFSMNSLITPHLIEKVEKGEYTHEGAGDFGDDDNDDQEDDDDESD